MLPDATDDVVASVDVVLVEDAVVDAALVEDALDAEELEELSEDDAVPSVEVSDCRRVCMSATICCSRDEICDEAVESVDDVAVVDAVEEEESLLVASDEDGGGGGGGPYAVVASVPVELDVESEEAEAVEAVEAVELEEAVPDELLSD